MPITVTVNYAPTLQWSDNTSYVVSHMDVSELPWNDKCKALKIFVDSVIVKKATDTCIDSGLDYVIVDGSSPLDVTLSVKEPNQENELITTRKVRNDSVTIESSGLKMPYERKDMLTAFNKFKTIFYKTLKEEKA